MLKLTLYFALAGMAFGELYGRPQFADPAPWPQGEACETSNGPHLLYSEDAREDAAAFCPMSFPLNYLGGSTDKVIKSVTVNNGILELVNPPAMYRVDFCSGDAWYSDVAAAPYRLVGQNAQNVFSVLHAAGYKVHRVTETITGKKAIWVEEHMAFRWQQQGQYVLAFALSPWFLVDTSTGNIEKVQAQEWAYVTLPAEAYKALQAVARYYAERPSLHCSVRNGAYDYEENMPVPEFPQMHDYSLPISCSPQPSHSAEACGP